MSVELETSAEAKTALSRLLVPLFAAFEREAIRYRVLRGYEGLPWETRNDVDLAVGPECVERAEQLIAEVARDTGWLRVGRSIRRELRRTKLFHPDHGVLPVDLCLSHEVWGMVYADADAVLAGEARHHGIRVACPGSEAAASLLKALLRHGTIKRRSGHRERLRHCLQEDPEGFLDCTQGRIGPALSRALLEACLREDWEAARALSGPLRRRLARRHGVLRVARNAGVAALRTRLRARSRRGDLDFQGGLFLCLLGPDGSGKTTLSRGLEERIGGLFARTEQYHSAAGVLPKLKGIKRLYYGLRGRPVPDSPLKGVAMPGVVAKPMPAIRSAAYIVYYGLEYVLYRLTVRRKLRRNQLVIFDRYFYDYYLMRVHRNAPRWLLAFFSRCIAQPDLLFVMLADPDAIHRRKPELTPDEIARQQAVLQGLRLPTAVPIDTSISLDRTLEEALEVIAPVLRGEPIPRPAAGTRQRRDDARELRAFLGCDFHSRPLKPVGLRLRNALKPWPIRQPQRAMSRLLVCRDGRRFKLLRFPASIRSLRDEIESRLQLLADHPCVPRLAWSDDRHLLVAWATGETPRADDPHFAERLGEAFGALYRVELRQRPRDEIIAPLRDQLRELERAGRVPAGSETRMAQRMADALPDSIPTSILCGDQTLANFVLDRQGSLHMIDPGSFQSGLPVDLFFLGHDGLYGRIDRDAFHRGYDRAEGIGFPFQHADALAGMQCVRQSALRCRVLDRTPWLERRRRRSLTRRVGRDLEALRRWLA